MLCSWAKRKALRETGRWEALMRHKGFLFLRRFVMNGALHLLRPCIRCRATIAVCQLTATAKGAAMPDLSMVIPTLVGCRQLRRRDMGGDTRQLSWGNLSLINLGQCALGWRSRPDSPMSLPWMRHAQGWGGRLGIGHCLYSAMVIPGIRVEAMCTSRPECARQRVQ